jgi:hypothetical protein
MQPQDASNRLRVFLSLTGEGTLFQDHFQVHLNDVTMVYSRRSVP